MRLRYLILPLIIIMALLAGCNSLKIRESLPDGTQSFRFQGKKFFIYPKDVFWPDESSQHLLKNTHINKGDTVLDLGTGMGVQAIFAAGKAAKVVATDINPLAVENARHNIRYHNLERKIELRTGDLFGPIGAEEKFDVIIFSPEYPDKIHKNTKKLLDGSIKDPDWDLIMRFFRNAGDHLNKNGRIYYILGLNRNMMHIKKIVTINKLRVKKADTIVVGDQMLTAFEITPVAK